MNLLFDFSGWVNHRQRGIGRYLVSVVESLLDEKYSNSISVDIILPNGKDTDVDELKQTFDIPGLKIFNGLNIPSTSTYDYFVVGDFFSSSTWLSLRNLKNCGKIVGIVYDLIPLVFAKDYLNKDLKRDLEYAIYLETLYIADHLFSISESTQEDLINLLGIEKEKITTLPSGFSNEFYVQDEDIISYEDRINSILMVSGNDRRKNYENATRGFLEALSKKLIPANSDFNIVCKNSKEFLDNIERITEKYPTYAKQVKVLGYVSDEELYELFRRSRITIFPSKYEGLGLPILESFASGTPCISSNNSSCKELNSPRFTFNPYSVEEIQDKIAQVFNSKKEWELCLSNGRSILSKFNWINGADKFVSELNKGMKNSSDKKESYLAMFGCYPPDKSGIADVNSEVLKQNQRIHGFMDPGAFISYYNLVKDDQERRYFSSELFEFLNFRFDYQSQIFVIGNSIHNLSTLNSAIKFGRKNSWLYLHEAEQNCLWRPFCNTIRASVDKFYTTFYRDLSLKKTYGLLPLLKVTGIKNFIVNNTLCKKIVEDELSGLENLTVVKAFLPINPLPSLVPPRISLDGEYIVGTFGGPSPLKGTHIVYKAVELLRKANVPVKLVVAGYGVNRYFQGQSKPDWLITVDSPSYLDLLRLQKAVDIAVQLRLKPHGESSGVICQLISLGTGIITTQNFVDEDLQPFVKEVSSTISENELADTIVQVMSSPPEGSDIKEARDNFLKHRTSKSLGHYLFQLTKNYE